MVGEKRIRWQRSGQNLWFLTLWHWLSLSPLPTHWAPIKHKSSTQDLTLRKQTVYASQIRWIKTLERPQPSSLLLSFLAYEWIPCKFHRKAHLANSTKFYKVKKLNIYTIEYYSAINKNKLSHFLIYNHQILLQENLIPFKSYNFNVSTKNYFLTFHFRKSFLEPKILIFELQYCKAHTELTSFKTHRRYTPWNRIFKILN